MNLFLTARDRTFRSLRHRNYRLYFFGQLVSFTGSWMQSAALMWFVFDRTADPLWPPLLLTAQVGPTLLLGPAGGALADRIPKRRLIFGTQFLFMAVTAAMTVALGTGVADEYLVLAAAAVNGLIQAFDLPARLAYVPDLIPRDDLINAVGLNSLLFNAARAVGPGLAGLLFVLADVLSPFFPGTGSVALGAAWCFGLNAASYLAVLAALRRIDVPGNPSAADGERGEFFDGFRYLAARRRLAGLVALTGAFSVFAWPTITLLPAYTKLELSRNEKSYAVLLCGIGAGALTAAVTTATFGSVARRRRFLLTGASIGFCALIGLGLFPSFVPAVTCCAALGFGLILYLSTGQSTMQLDVPQKFRGRIMALWAMTLSVSAPLGHLVFGTAARDIPVSTVLLVMAGGVGLVLVGLVWVTRQPRAE